MTARTAAVEALPADREHGASWMARRTVETLLEVSEQPFEASPELFDALMEAGRRLAESRPGVGAIAGAAGRVLAAANGWRHLDLDHFRKLIEGEGHAVLEGRRRAAASIAIQLQERLQEATGGTPPAAATRR